MPTRINHKTHGQVLAESSHPTRSYWERLIGLMGRKALTQGEGLIIDPCSSVYMFWMRFAIDVIYVNNEHVVVGIDNALRPWLIGHFFKCNTWWNYLPATGSS